MANIGQVAAQLGKVVVEAGKTVVKSAGRAASQAGKSAKSGPEPLDEDKSKQTLQQSQFADNLKKIDTQELACGDVSQLLKLCPSASSWGKQLQAQSRSAMSQNNKPSIGNTLRPGR